MLVVNQLTAKVVSIIDVTMPDLGPINALLAQYFMPGSEIDHEV